MHEYASFSDDGGRTSVAQLFVRRRKPGPGMGFRRLACTEQPPRRGYIRDHNPSTSTTFASICPRLSKFIHLFQSFSVFFNLYQALSIFIQMWPSGRKSGGRTKEFANLVALSRSHRFGEQRNLTLPKSIKLFHTFTSFINLYPSLPIFIILFRPKSSCTGLHQKRKTERVLTHPRNSVTMIS